MMFRWKCRVQSQLICTVKWDMFCAANFEKQLARAICRRPSSFPRRLNLNFVASPPPPLPLLALDALLRSGAISVQSAPCSIARKSDTTWLLWCDSFGSHCTLNLRPFSLHTIRRFVLLGWLRVNFQLCFSVLFDGQMFWGNVCSVSKTV